MATLNLDIADHIIACADNELLLTLSRVCRYFCQRCRRVLFKSITFRPRENGLRISQFLDLLDHPHNTIAHAIQSLQFYKLYLHLAHPSYERRNMPELAQKLVNLTQLRIDCLYGPGYFIETPLDSILGFITHLPATRVEIDWAVFPENTELIQIWNCLPFNTKQIALYDVNILHNPLPSEWDGEGRSEKSGFPPSARPCGPNLQFDLLDNTSLASLQEIGLLTNVSATPIVDRFHLRFYSRDDRRLEATVSTVSSFLRRSGPAIKHLTIDLKGFRGTDPVALYAPRIDFSQCTNLLTASVGIVELGGEGNAHLKNTMWTAFSCLPTPSSIQCIKVIFCVGRDEHQLAEALDAYPWVDLVVGLKKMFAQLSTLKITIGSYVNIETTVVDNHFRSHVLREMENVSPRMGITFEAIHWLNMNYANRLRGRDFLCSTSS